MEEIPLPTPPQKPLARLILAAFVLTFTAARVMVILIMARLVPDFYFHAGQTHVHHLNYGIFLLSGVGAFLLLRRPTGKALSLCAIVYGVGLALTFDEFGMWLHLGGSYWQRASFDAVVTIAAVLGLIAVAPSPSAIQAARLDYYRPRRRGRAGLRDGLGFLTYPAFFAVFARDRTNRPELGGTFRMRPRQKNY